MKKSNVGRPRLSEKDKTVSIHIKMTGKQKAKLKRLGGVKWIRLQIDLACTDTPLLELINQFGIKVE